MNYNLDIENSFIKWTGYQPSNELSGKVYFERGIINSASGLVTGGDLLLDMRSIITIDQKLDEENRNKLTNHLKSEAFFDVDIYPKVRIYIRESKELSDAEADACRLESVIQATHRVFFDFELKHYKKSMSVPARVNIMADKLTAEALVKLDRTEFDINFMIEESFGDQKILPEFHVLAHIVGLPEDGMS